MSLIEGLNSLTKIESLELHFAFTQLTDESIYSLSDCLMGFIALEKLYLDFDMNNEISSLGLLCLLKCLKKMEQVQVIDLNFVASKRESMDEIY